MKKSNRVAWVVGVIVVIAIVILGWQNSVIDVVRIGVIESLTGNAAYYGEQNRKGVDIAAEEISRDYPEFNFEVFHEDSAYLPKIGLDAYRSLRDIRQIDAVITHASAISVALQPVVSQDGILQMAASASTAGYSSPADLSFRTSTSAEVESKYVADFIMSEGYKNVAIYYMNNEIGESMSQEVEKALLDNGVQVVFNEAFLFESSDFRTDLQKIQQAGANVIFIPSLARHTALLLKQSNELNIDMPFVGFRGSEDPLLIEQAGELAEDFVYTYAFDASSEDETVMRFVSAYEAAYGEAPTGYSAEGYESFKLTALAFIECGKDYGCIQDYLENLKDYDSVFGKLSFDENGDVYYIFFPKTVRNGKFVRLDKY